MDKITTVVSEWLTCFFLLVFPFFTTKLLFYGTVNGKSFLLIAFTSTLLLLASVRIFARTYTTNFALKKNFLLFALFGIIISVVASAILGVYPERSFWSDILRGTGVIFMLYVFLMTLVLRANITQSGWSMIRRSIALSAALFSFFTIIGVAGFGYTGNAFGIPFQSTGLSLGNETFAGAYLLLSICLTYLEYIKQSTSLHWKRVLFGLLVLQVSSPLFIGWKAIFSGEIFTSFYQIFGLARSSSITLILVALYMLGVYIYSRLPSKFDYAKKNILRVWVVIWALGVVYVMTALFIPGTFVYQKHVELTGPARPVVWSIGIESFKERPILGWGPENFRIAFEKNFSPKLLNGEVWFDRAHNFFVDTAVNFGAVGMLAFLLFVVAFYSVIVRAQKKGVISFTEANILGALFVAHILQIQTSFDVIPTYALLAVIVAYVLSLERSIDSAILFEKKGTSIVCKGIALILLVTTLAGLWSFGYKEYVRQRSLVKTFVTADSALQSKFLKIGLSRTSSFESIRIGSASFIKGTISKALAAKNKADQQKIIAMARPHVEIYKNVFKQALTEFPKDYRLRMNYAYLLVVSTALFGSNDLSEARNIVTNSYELSPRNPLTYMMHSLVELYSGNIKLAEDLIVKGLAIEPSAKFTNGMAKYIRAQIQSFPEISIVKLENL